ncbi:XRN 5'-3' exonuclease N-terminus-domain-containing protein [Lineolata rhizophorae]|uniref:5'-3' exoribonuclease 1 n=1 Tax=Lineolata rhizophorae TaxID=578093 RepID=A0A6A6NVA7_9PEZI|nr:XRN 5'-3' exonuclease N-terminus-domain-containing protein [Lineolata rhizophorae]
MGVPKFFRWMSERYPTISQLIAENRIPEFDCLYLDMNGIIHNCTHNDSDSPTHRMSEDKMFIAIFNYIEHLFGKIKPKQLFFMAIDGVAPRAKMNQQRARRFRTALDAEMAREKAIREGIEMPKEDPFDSNCITPGTEFMAKLTVQLKYFVNKKVSEDKDWQGVEVVLSGHEVPGEGEHKIMEYIRQTKSQPNYDPNMRHCLYGLDADLIMLGLLSHDPHFCLLREEVTFGRQSQKKSKELEHQNFYLLHLCVVREYLELEFQELEAPDALSFPFDMERVIDDFILMAFFVGNDFLPNLPHLHINEGALALMFNVYKTVLPKAKGYLNEGGVINLERLALLLDELSHVEYRFFESEVSDAAWFKGKQMGKEDVMEKTKRRGQLVITPKQREIFRGIKNYVNSRSLRSELQPYDLPASLPASDRKFVEELADNLHVKWKTVEDENGDRHLQLSFPPRVPMNGAENEEDDEEEKDDEEAQIAMLRVLKKYENAKVEEMTADDAQAEMQKKYEKKFHQWKDNYYKSKIGWGLDNEDEMRKMTENYVQGLQWVLYYYYRGVVSWPWFYGYHYSPMISDVKKGLNADMDFKLGQPFRPFQQLMGVLPDRSKQIVPQPYHDLMTNPESPIIDFYPRDFELDMNGKKMDWEAVVKIPFIEEKRLLAAMGTKEGLLSEDERNRNEFGVSLKFTYTSDLDYAYPSSLPGIFPDLEHCHCIENIFELPTMEGLEVYVGLVDGVQLGVAALAGFPSLKVLPFHGQLGFHGVSVFQQESRNESMVLTLVETEERSKISKARERLGKAIHVGYPFLQEAKVVKVSDELFDYTLATDGSGQVIQTPHNPHEIGAWKKKSDRVESVYSKRLGIIIGSVESLVHVAMLKGLRKTDDGATVKEYGEIPGMETDYATQTIVDDVVSEDARFIEREALPIEEEFPIDSKAFYLGEFNYGRPLQITGHIDQKAEVWVLTLKGREPEFGREIARNAERLTPYTPSFAVAKMLRLNPLVLSKLTSSFSVNSSGLKLNLGLNLKFEAKKQKVLGYSRRSATGWEFSPKAINLITEYMLKFPEFIAGISRNPKGDLYEDTNFYPEDIAKTKMKEIGAWLKSIESKSFERVPLEAEQLDSEVVKAIEQAANAALASGPEPEPRRIRGVPRAALLKPSDAESRLGGQKFALGDRVVYVQDSGRVPIGGRGTVVGMTRTARVTLLDVVFDTTFMSGTTLGDRCSPFRGSTVPATSVLNLTTKQVIAWSKASTAKQPQQQFQPLTVQNRVYGAPMATSGQPQLFPAAAPPPLRGSFRGAVTGHLPGPRGSPRSRGRGDAAIQNGHTRQTALPFHPANRGARGGNTVAPRGQHMNGQPLRARGGNTNCGPPLPGQRNHRGYVVVDQMDPNEGVGKRNSNFRPQSYAATPPPASLNAGRGGRVRGGRGGRGGDRGVRARGPNADRGRGSTGPTATS